MTKAELYAKHYLFSDINIIEEITSEEFHASTAKGEMSNHSSNEGMDSFYKVQTDGMDYYGFHSTYQIGWQGDYNGDSFYCKIKRYTKAERDELIKIFM